MTSVPKDSGEAFFEVTQTLVARNPSEEIHPFTEDDFDELVFGKKRPVALRVTLIEFDTAILAFEEEWSRQDS